MDVIIRAFRLSKTSLEVRASYNIAPSQAVLIVRADNNGARQAEMCRWGFLPFWAKDPAMGHKMINARAETVAVKPSFRSAFTNHRCLVIANGFYEWRKGQKGKVPFYIHLKSGQPFGFAGLFSHWRLEKDDEGICTCTIITTDANELLAPIHDRMPVILPKDKEDLWLDADNHDRASLENLLKPYPSREMEAYEISARVNSPKVNDAGLMHPASGN